MKIENFHLNKFSKELKADINESIPFTVRMSVLLDQLVNEGVSLYQLQKVLNIDYQSLVAIRAMKREYFTSESVNALLFLEQWVIDNDYL